MFLPAFVFQVANVAALGVSAVLIYPEHKNETTELYGHVSTHTHHSRVNLIDDY